MHPDYKIKTEKNATVLSLDKETLGLYDVPEIDSITADILKSKPERLVLDFAAIKLLDSSAVGFLVKLGTKTDEIGTELILAQVNDKTTRLLGGLMTSYKFVLMDTIEDALKS